ncbi:beta-lactamase class A [Saccharopolyspora erythraea NRRL 2338]|uniref:Beta lactamase n=2 Tax=Saccharopolyspora erythraea TaxID=1836 RepID=A4F9H0_SACEN|nr:serine hydrolase [Saccharopolyspora erythraea]EQD87360.1 beta-lactamase [Saccharopolyspora erythraea D]PFG94482.1 beta-lactamase class A [Saccharopolyspora erythraea NRRL 2338]QRK91238.1 serine hydrolase [Saccharopolyspora erythraea]CAM00695.1 beta lactamase [Saccharopolyspora erythraea NRRL 2338]
MSGAEQEIREVLRDAGAEGWVHAMPLTGATTRVSAPAREAGPAREAWPGSGTEAGEFGPEAGPGREGRSGSETGPGREIGIGADDLVVTASVYKLPLVVALCRAFDAGRIDPRARVRLNPPSCTPGPTGLATFLDPVTVSWRDMAASMIGVSDNTSADVILGEVGLDAVAETLAELGLERTRVVGGTADSHASLVRDTGAATAAEAFAELFDNDAAHTVSAYDPAYASATTPREMTRLLDLIWSDAVASPQQCAFIRRLLSNQVWMHRVRAGFPSRGVHVAGKTGTVGAVRNEVSVVEFEGEVPVAVAVFTLAARADAFLPKVDAAIADCARIAVNDLRSGRL